MFGIEFTPEAIDDLNRPAGRDEARTRIGGLRKNQALSSAGLPPATILISSPFVLQELHESLSPSKKALPSNSAFLLLARRAVRGRRTTRWFQMAASGTIFPWELIHCGDLRRSEAPLAYEEETR
jgi:hypothetical protein